MSFQWISKINYHLPVRTDSSEKWKERSESNLHTAYNCLHDDVELGRNSSSKSKGYNNKLAGEFGASDASTHDEKKEPNTEMREKLFMNLSNTFQPNLNKDLKESFGIHELPCSGEGGKWKMIRMYQERARRREARRKRERQKQREKSRSKKRKRSKSKKRSKSGSRKKRRKSKGRSRSKSKRRGRSRSRSKQSGRSKSKSKRRGRSKSRSKRRGRSRSRSKSRKPRANSTARRGSRRRA